MPNKLSQFWQKLKRRNVVRVITVYAGAAFVILELVDIIAEPLKLPSWLLPVVIILLSVGFVITVIVSWIYDVHPEGGKTWLRSLKVIELEYEEDGRIRTLQGKDWLAEAIFPYRVFCHQCVLGL